MTWFPRKTSRFDRRATESMRPRNVIVSLGLAIVAGLGGELSPAIVIPHTKPQPQPETDTTQAIPAGWRRHGDRRTCAAALKRAAKKRQGARARSSKRRAPR